MARSVASRWGLVLGAGKFIVSPKSFYCCCDASATDEPPPLVFVLISLNAEPPSPTIFRSLGSFKARLSCKMTLLTWRVVPCAAGVGLAGGAVPLLVNIIFFQL